MPTIQQLLLLNLRVGWLGVAAGILSGLTVGLWFHQENWLGGYGSHPRRLLRLGHISFFGLGFLNLLFALTLFITPYPLTTATIISFALIVGAVTMPICCVLCAWRRSLHCLFPIPVVSLCIAVGLIVAGFSSL